MTLHLNLPDARLSKLQQLAASSGRSVEEVAGQLLGEKLDGLTTTADQSDRWSYNGVPWKDVPAAERGERDRAAYSIRPITDEEVEIHPEDLAAFENEYW